MPSARLTQDVHSLHRAAYAEIQELKKIYEAEARRSQPRFTAGNRDCLTSRRFGPPRRSGRRAPSRRRARRWRRSRWKQRKAAEASTKAPLPKGTSTSRLSTPGPTPRPTQYHGNIAWTLTDAQIAKMLKDEEPSEAEGSATGDEIMKQTARRAGAKMLVHIGLRCACHYLPARECPLRHLP